MDLVCDQRFMQLQDLKRHMATIHQASQGYQAAILFARGKVSSLDERGSIASYLHSAVSAATRAEANQRDDDTAIKQEMHLSQDSRDFWETVLDNGTCLADLRSRKREAEGEGVHEEEEHAAKRRRLDTAPTKPPQKVSELIAEAIVSSPGQQMSFEEIQKYVCTHYPWYARRRAALRACLQRSPSPSSAKVKHFEQRQGGRWGLTAGYRAQLGKQESKPILTGLLISSLTAHE
jgi:hypothetical protein